MKESVVLSFIILAIWPFVHSHIVFFHLTGALKEVRETPSKPQHKLVEFFDTRDAARALAELNGKEINGRRLLLEFGRPGSGQVRSQKLLLNMLDNHCIQCNEQIREGADDPYSAYDFVYLPIDFK
ncbi:hypothetical protein B296_00055732 [Ensete ventricosum]|uniref:RRM domain-containing protein n=1 Tax=Ensete ventricosum TaxID=4639 RepID=A0A426X3H0_ENSVE|nr:hypothetical protein B296_00055732 [Ensete ventricosum]